MNMYLKTKEMAKRLGYSADYLLNNRELLFFKGEHYFIQNKRINWKIEKMIGWIENKNMSIQALEIIERIS